MHPLIDALVYSEEVKCSDSSFFYSKLYNNKYALNKGKHSTFTPYIHFNMCMTSVYPDQAAKNNLMNVKANSVDPNQIAQMYKLIWILTVG
jgi:hypothetical protein